MKLWKNVAFILLYAVLLLGTGFLGGALFVKNRITSKQQVIPDQMLAVEEAEALSPENNHVKQNVILTKEQENALVDPVNAGQVLVSSSDTAVGISQSALSEEVMTHAVTLNADTAYVLEETDLRDQSVVETRWSLPVKYIGMDRQGFLEAMEVYEAAPPLQELERGFVGLEVLSFSEEEVVVQMNYDYVEPSQSFYLMVRNNFIVVCLEDQKTIYMETGILLKDLPEQLQQDIIQIMLIPDEESLYDFLENYSS